MKKRFQRTGGLLLAAALLLGAVGLPAAAEEEAPVSDGWQYRLIFDGARAQICGYVGEETVLTLPAEVNGLPVWSVDGSQGEGLQDNDAVTAVTFPDSVRVIQSAFNGCDALETVELPANVYEITASFNNCSRLAEVFLPDSLAVCSSSMTNFSEEEGAVLYTHPLRKMHEGLCRRMFSTRSEGIEIVPYAYTVGDVNADNAIDTTDARLILQAAAKRVALTAEQLAAADVDGSGAVDSTDARRCLQHAARRSELEDQLIHREPLFDMDLDTAQATVYWYDTTGAERSCTVEDAALFAQKAQNAAEAEQLVKQQYTQGSVYTVVITWGERTAAEQVTVSVKSAGSEWAYGGVTYQGGLPALGWWTQELSRCGVADVRMTP